VAFVFAAAVFGTPLAVGIRAVAGVGTSAFALDVECRSLDRAALAIGAAAAIGGPFASVRGTLASAAARVAGAREIAHSVVRRRVVARQIGGAR
jgi:hypothetical protein